MDLTCTFSGVSPEAINQLMIGLVAIMRDMGCKCDYVGAMSLPGMSVYYMPLGGKVREVPRTLTIYGDGPNFYHLLNHLFVEKVKRFFFDEGMPLSSGPNFVRYEKPV